MKCPHCSGKMMSSAVLVTTVSHGFSVTTPVEICPQCGIIVPGFSEYALDIAPARFSRERNGQGEGE